VISVAVVLGLSLVLLFLLTQATDNRELYERNYRQLFGLNVVVATLLMGVIGWMSVRLLLRLRQGRFGSRLLLKIAATFALVGFVPGLLIYSVSYQFVSRSIESWFDVKVEGALDAGLSLGRTTLDTLANDLGQKTRSATSQINDLPDASVGIALERIKDQLGADDVILWSITGQALSSAGESRYKINPDRPSPTQLRLVKTQSMVTAIDGLDEAELQGNAKARIRALVLVAPSGLGLLIEPRVLQVTKAIPPTLVRQCTRGRGGQPRIPRAGTSTRWPAQHVHRHPDAQSVSGRVRRSAVGGAAGQPVGPPAADVGRGRARCGSR